MSKLLPRRNILKGIAATAPFLLLRPANAGSAHYKVVVYGGTMAGIMAAVAVARQEYSVALVLGPNALGGVVANGLSRGDITEFTYTGGLAERFYRRLGGAYGQPYIFNYEPHVAERVARSFLTEWSIPIYTGALKRVSKTGTHINAIVLTDGTALFGWQYIDASYEGELMAATGTYFTWGRESQARRGESLAGFGVGTKKLSFASHSASGALLPGFVPTPSTAVGAGDRRVMAYCFRMCVTNVASNRKPFPKPPVYVPANYKLRLETISNGEQFLHAGGTLPNGKFDMNGGGLMDDDFIGGSYGYPTADAPTRAAIVQDHYNYQAGLLYFLANDPSVPKSYRDTFGSFGLAANEFTDNHGWPRQLYVRQARRLVGRYVITENDIRAGRRHGDAIGIIYQGFDCHWVTRYPAADGGTILEGHVGEVSSDQRTVQPYHVPYRALTPQAANTDNLLVPVCASTTHIANTSLRLEHHYMIMGEAAGVAAALAYQHQIPVQKVPVSDLQSILLQN